MNTLDAAALTFIRLEHGYSRDDLVHMLDVDPTRLRRWETGKEAIPPGIAADLAQIESRAAAAAAAIVDDRAAKAGATITARKAAGEHGRAPVEYEPLILGPLDQDDAFWQVWPEHQPMPARWWWNVARKAERYGIRLERGRTYSR